MGAGEPRADVPSYDSAALAGRAPLFGYGPRVWTPSRSARALDGRAPDATPRFGQQQLSRHFKVPGGDPMEGGPMMPTHHNPEILRLLISGL